jgi:FtsH-binding integral membrane protein
MLIERARRISSAFDVNSQKEISMNSGYNPPPPSNDPWGASSSTHGQPLTVAQSSAQVQLNFIRKTYVLFMAGILSAIVAGVLCLQTPLLNVAVGILNMPLLAFGLIVGGSIGAQALARKEGLNYVALFGFTSFLGFIMAPVLASVEFRNPGILGQTSFLSTLVFGSLTAYAFISRKDFNFLGGIAFVGIIAMIGGSLANMLWFKSSGFGYWIAWGTLLFSSAFVLYQTSRMIHDYDPREYCAAALGLFISFFNIFFAILRILGGSRD